MPGGTFRFKDVSGQVFAANYIANYAYSNAQVQVSLNTSEGSFLAGTIQAQGLKPNFAYQVKLGGRNTRLGANGDDATNERLGLIGRWWRAYPNPANAKDDDYFAHKDDPNYAYSGYLIIGFFITDAQGGATLHLEGDNSFHVLWRTNQRSPAPNDGPIDTFVLPATTGNPAYDVTNPSQPLGIYGEWEPTRVLPGTLAMPNGHYACDFVLTEESFHDSGPNAGNWTAALSAPIAFDIGTPPEIQWSSPAEIVYPTPLSAVQLNAVAQEPGKFVYTPPLGTILNAGANTLSVQFTPDSTGITLPPATVNLNVLKGTPRVIWNPPQNVRANAPLDETALNASADVAGTFSYEPSLGTRLAPGQIGLSLQFIPADLANYNLPPFQKFDVIAVVGLLITSGPWATPNPAYVDEPIQFGAATEARDLAWSWDFGDGTPPSSGSIVTHAFSVPGNYAVKVIAQVPRGRSETEMINISVLPVPGGLNPADESGDADGDGFCDALELACGSDVNNVASTPFSATNGLFPLPLKMQKFSVRLPAMGASLTGHFKINFSATFNASSNFNTAYARLALTTAGHAVALNLDSSARAHVGGSRFSVMNRVTRNDVRTLTLNASWTGTFNVPPAAWSAPYNDGTLRDQTVMLIFGDTVYSANIKSKLKNARGSVIITSVK